MENQVPNLPLLLVAGVYVTPIVSEVIDHVKTQVHSETMTLNVGNGIKEHKHGYSLYFAKNALLTINGEKQKVPWDTFLAIIPKGISHGWQNTGEGASVISSFDSGHDLFETYAL
jgi:quercetin dioxygenase-like cupin family protein